MHSILISTRKGLFVANVFASTDRGESWSVVSNYLPPVYAVTFA